MFTVTRWSSAQCVLAVMSDGTWATTTETSWISSTCNNKESCKWLDHCCVCKVYLLHVHVHLHKGLRSGVPIEYFLVEFWGKAAHHNHRSLARHNWTIAVDLRFIFNNRGVLHYKLAVPARVVARFLPKQQKVQLLVPRHDVALLIAHSSLTLFIEMPANPQPWTNLRYRRKGCLSCSFGVKRKKIKTDETFRKKLPGR